LKVEEVYIYIYIFNMSLQIIAAIIKWTVPRINISETLITCRNFGRHYTKHCS